MRFVGRRLRRARGNFERRSLQSVAGVDKSEALRKADAICHEYGRAAFADVYDDATRLLTFRCLEP